MIINTGVEILPLLNLKKLFTLPSKFSIINSQLSIKNANF